MDQFSIGEEVDIENNNGIWCNGEITQLADKRVRVMIEKQEEGWKAREKVLKQYKEGDTSIRLNNRLYVKQGNNNRLRECRVLMIDSDNPRRVEVGFKGMTKSRNEWIILEEKEKVRGIGQMHKQQKEEQEKKQRKREEGGNDMRWMEEYKEKEGEMREQLKRQGMKIICIAMDGNCLFRAISHQLYGQDTYHSQMRILVMEYLLIREYYFHPFITGSLLMYTQHKSHSGVWADDLEIQALADIYQLDIHIYQHTGLPIRKLFSNHQQDQHNTK